MKEVDESLGILSVPRSRLPIDHRLDLKLGCHVTLSSLLRIQEPVLHVRRRDQAVRRSSHQEMAMTRDQIIARVPKRSRHDPEEERQSPSPPKIGRDSKAGR